MAHPGVAFDGTTFHMVYSTFSGKGHDVKAIGYASSTDGVLWSKSKRPIIEPRDGEKLFTGPCLLIEGHRLNMYYPVWAADSKAEGGVRTGIRLARAHLTR